MTSVVLFTTVPSVPCVTALTDNVSPGRSTSVSLASTSMVTATSSLVVSASSPATGASFTALTVTVTVAVSVPPLPSLRV